MKVSLVYTINKNSKNSFGTKITYNKARYFQQLPKSFFKTDMKTMKLGI